MERASQENNSRLRDRGNISLVRLQHIKSCSTCLQMIQLDYWSARFTLQLDKLNITSWSLLHCASYQQQCTSDSVSEQFVTNYVSVLHGFTFSFVLSSIHCIHPCHIDTFCSCLALLSHRLCHLHTSPYSAALPKSWLSHTMSCQSQHELCTQPQNRS